MPEVLPPFREFDPAPAISNVLRKWLMKEIGSSMFTHNAVLDDWDKHQADLLKPFERRDNTNTEKAKAHHSRMIEWVKQVDEFPDLALQDKFLARQMFG